MGGVWHGGFDGWVLEGSGCSAGRHYYIAHGPSI